MQTLEGELSLADLAWQVGDVQSIVRVPRHPLYLDSTRPERGWLDLGLRTTEECGFPMGPDFVFAKAYESEVRTTPTPVRSIGLPSGLCVELKLLDAADVAHRTDPTSSATSCRTERKRREWEVFSALLADPDVDLPGIHRIDAPPGVHIVDHVTRTWLPQAPRPLDVGTGVTSDGRAR